MPRSTASSSCPAPRDYTRETVDCIRWLTYLQDAAERGISNDPVPADTVQDVLGKLDQVIADLRGRAVTGAVQDNAASLVLKIAVAAREQLRRPEDVHDWDPPPVLAQVVAELQEQRDAQQVEFDRLHTARCEDHRQLAAWCRGASVWLLR